MENTASMTQRRCIPLLTFAHFELFSSLKTRWPLPTRNSRNQIRAFPWMWCLAMAPSKLSCGTLSKALWKSIYTMSTCFLLSNSSFQSNKLRSFCKFIERPWMKPDCQLQMMPFDDKNSTRCFRVIFSTMSLHIDLNQVVCSFSLFRLFVDSRYKCTFPASATFS